VGPSIFGQFGDLGTSRFGGVVKFGGCSGNLLATEGRAGQDCSSFLFLCYIIQHLGGAQDGVRGPPCLGARYYYYCCCCCCYYYYSIIINIFISIIIFGIYSMFCLFGVFAFFRLFSKNVKAALGAP